VRLVIILTACTVACACTRHRASGPAGDRITVCGMLRTKDGAPISKALLRLYKLPKDTWDDVVANSYELTETDADGRFVLRSTYADRQYWLAIERSSGCEGLTSSELESRRIPMTFHRSTGEEECASMISAVLDNGCNLTFR
jgi:hypothetical protein